MYFEKKTQYQFFAKAVASLFENHLYQLTKNQIVKPVNKTNNESNGKKSIFILAQN